MNRFLRAGLLLLCVLPAAAGNRKSEPAGVPEGSRIPDTPIYTLDGRETALSTLWADGPVLMVAASLTCPVARQTCFSMDSLTNRYRIVVLYTLEAHPKGDPSPYRDREWIHPDNVRDHILLPQPRRLEERLQLARQFQSRLDLAQPLYVDNMQNEAWRNLGAKPNAAVLVDRDGTVLKKQGWFKPDKLTDDED